MSRNGSGTYSLPAGNPVVTGTTISSAWANNTFNDVASALTQSVSSDGQTPMTGNLNVNGNQISNLSAGSTAGNAVEWSQFAALTGGRIIQSIVATTGTAYTTSSSYISTGHQATITPTSTSSKILILCSALLEQTNVYASAGISAVALYKNGSNVVSGSDWQMVAVSSGANYGSFALSYLDSPNTTSSLTYAIYFRAGNSANVVYNNNGNAGQLILMEIL